MNAKSRKSKKSVPAAVPAAAKIVHTPTTLLRSLVADLRRREVFARNDVAAFAERVAKSDSPLHDLQWAEGAFEAAARLHVATHLLKGIDSMQGRSPRTVIETLYAEAHDTAMCRGCYRHQSTSAVRNLAEACETEEWSRAVSTSYMSSLCFAYKMLAEASEERERLTQLEHEDLRLALDPSGEGDAPVFDRCEFVGTKFGGAATYRCEHDDTGTAFLADVSWSDVIGRFVGQVQQGEVFVARVDRGDGLQGLGVVEASGAPSRRPCYWTFDDVTAYAGFTDDTYWNGFLNVWVTAETHARVVQDIAAEGGEASTVDCLVADSDGLYSYANGYATSELREGEVVTRPGDALTFSVG